MIERMLSDYARAYGIQSIALRYFNAAGADPESALSVPLAGLAAGWPSEELWLAIDPASEDGLALPPEAVRALPAFLDGAEQSADA